MLGRLLDRVAVFLVTPIGSSKSGWQDVVRPALYMLESGNSIGVLRFIESETVASHPDRLKILFYLFEAACYRNDIRVVNAILSSDDPILFVTRTVPLLHALAIKGMTEPVLAILEKRPELLVREGAVGTVLEAALLGDRQETVRAVARKLVIVADDENSPGMLADAKGRLASHNAVEVFERLAAAEQQLRRDDQSDRASDGRSFGDRLTAVGRRARAR